MARISPSPAGGQLAACGHDNTTPATCVLCCAGRLSRPSNTRLSGQMGVTLWCPALLLLRPVCGQQLSLWYYPLFNAVLLPNVGEAGIRLPDSFQSSHRYSFSVLYSYLTELVLFYAITRGTSLLARCYRGEGGTSLFYRATALILHPTPCALIEASKPP